jgi:hypothetical protein
MPFDRSCRSTQRRERMTRLDEARSRRRPESAGDADEEHQQERVPIRIVDVSFTKAADVREALMVRRSLCHSMSRRASRSLETDRPSVRNQHITVSPPGSAGWINAVGALFATPMPAFQEAIATVDGRPGSVENGRSAQSAQFTLTRRVSRATP